MSAITVRIDQPLIGVIVCEDGHELTRYFTDEQEADASVTPISTRDAQSAIGAWRDFDWGEMEQALDRIRNETNPTPPIVDL